MACFGKACSENRSGSQISLRGLNLYLILGKMWQKFAYNPSEP